MPTEPLSRMLQDLNVDPSQLEMISQVYRMGSDESLNLRLRSISIGKVSFSAHRGFDSEEEVKSLLSKYGLPANSVTSVGGGVDYQVELGKLEVIFRGAPY